ncbi:hypothetical protein [Klebsiella sp. BIGb0407]|uniref:hypothetical protein n=1 Tax=Klebsiella sp. BIGb0407 TaxID=2940603 RepID=UPI0021671C2A|nr:hypothetical protein [Klebsiella sp. BIGb0407]MCS3433560.1 hypothetical protein [Klebsiella sp. BIGb0407]
MKRIAVLSLTMILTAPVLAIDMPPPLPIKSIDWVQDSTIRIGQGINAAYRVTTMTGQISEIWIHTDCQTQDKTLLFIDTQPGKGLRVYSTDSIDRYIPGSVFEPDADSLFMTTSGLNLCTKNIPEPLWVGISSRSQSGEKQFVDVNNSLREGAMLKVRLATDYDKIYHDEKYGAPYSVKIEGVLLNCEKMEGMALTTFSLDNQGVVTDTRPAKNATFTALTPDMTRVTKELCSNRDLLHYQGSGTLNWRNKTVADTAPAHPDIENNSPAALQRFALPTEVIRIIDSTFSDPQQKPNFRSITYTQNGPEKGGPGLMAKIDTQPDGTTLTIMKMMIGNAVFYSQYQRLFNMVDIKKWEIMSDAPWVSKTLDNTIALPLSPGKVYSSHSQIGNRDKPETDKSLSQTCVASKEWHNAAELNPKFPGRYLVFICKNDLGDGKEASSDYAYFDTLRVFIRIGFQANGQAKRFTFTDVRITD